MLESFLLKQKAHKIKPNFFLPVHICFAIRTISVYFRELIYAILSQNSYIVLHEFFENICIAMAYSKTYTCKASHNLHAFIHVVCVAVLRRCFIRKCY